MPHTVHEKRRVLARVRRLKGQIAALESALEADVDCGTFLQQVAAVRGAVGGLMRQVLQAHVRETLGPSAKNDGDREAAVAELEELLRAYMK